MLTKKINLELDPSGDAYMEISGERDRPHLCSEPLIAQEFVPRDGLVPLWNKITVEISSNNGGNEPSLKHSGFINAWLLRFSAIMAGCKISQEHCFLQFTIYGNMHDFIHNECGIEVGDMFCFRIYENK